ncbi:uncharacterized protein LOC114267140 [Camellia sinensis]|uniref:uncharacterized protein LOC114267140 n=1 Tax=Camellia sinensis TaxID=4442 RepID=UPI0010359C2C|nr:uncharacterized protein LOC114267140 [Camellia sinensis]
MIHLDLPETKNVFIQEALINGQIISVVPTTSKRLAERKVEKFEKNISKRGLPKKGYNYSVELIVLGLLVFVIVGSYIFQMIRAATSGEIA